MEVRLNMIHNIFYYLNFIKNLRMAIENQQMNVFTRELYQR